MAGHRKAKGAPLLAEQRARRRNARLQVRLKEASGDPGRRFKIAAGYMLTAIRRGDRRVVALVVEQVIVQLVQHAETIWQESP